MVIKAKEGYTLVNKDKTFVYGKVLTVNIEDFDDYIEVADSEIEEVRKAIEAKILEDMKKHE